MKKRTLLLAGCILLSISLHAQDGDDKKKHKEMTVFASAGRSTFHGGTANFAFPSLEVSAGIGTGRPIAQHWSADARFALGVRLKSDAPLPPKGGGFGVHEAAGRDNYFWEIPVSLQYHLPRADLLLRAGGSFRHYFANKDVAGFLAGNNDAGLTAGVGYIFSDRIRLNAEYYHGLTEIYSAGGHYAGEPFRLNLQSRGVQVTVGYGMGRGRHRS